MLSIVSISLLNNICAIHLVLISFLAEGAKLQYTESTVKSLLNRYSNFLPRHLHNMLLRFNNFLLTEGKNPASRYTYLNRIGMFFRDMIKRKGESFDVRSLTWDDVESFLADLSVKSSDKTLLAYVMALRKFLGYVISITEDKSTCERLEKILQNLKTPRVREKLPEVIPEKDVFKILEAIDDPTFKTFFAVMYETGARKGELSAVKIGDVEFDEYGALITLRSSKSEPRKVRVIMFADMLKEYINRHPLKNDPEAPLFPARRNIRKPIPPSTISYMFNKLSLITGYHVYPHLLRHVRATTLYKHQVLTEKEMMLMFGWKTRKMIDVYSKITQKDVDEKLIKYYREKLKKRKVRFI
ncbi:hypothetical protein DRO02_01465 [archaeon]|nr:MAG: hypothetical protein DRO02_01465 [archaeon]